jgi:hypothetical protein
MVAAQKAGNLITFHFFIEHRFFEHGYLLFFNQFYHIQSVNLHPPRRKIQYFL